MNTPHAPAGRKYVVVTPCRDEADHIERTVLSMAAQTVRPAQWVIVNDGSTDATAQVLDRCTAGLAWITVVHRANRGFRAAGGGVMEAFYAGHDALGHTDWDYLVKLDGDLSFEADYFASCLDEFEREPKLGVGGGTVCKLENARVVIDSVGDPVFHVRGATKIYRRACWEQIHPLVRAPGWDTIDEVRANFHGWTSRTFASFLVIQHKPTGSADGQWRNAYKNGLANYITGYHPAFMVAKSLKRALRKPYGVNAAALMLGYLSGHFKKVPRQGDAGSIAYLRQQQLRRLLMRPSIYSDVAGHGGKVVRAH
ncbi:MAG: hypothetical protein JWP52_4102 [Rhizobacter sp.]|nr:hypothetical protein [Rhizobacter sp.]